MNLVVFVMSLAKSCNTLMFVILVEGRWTNIFHYLDEKQIEQKEKMKSVLFVVTQRA